MSTASSDDVTGLLLQWNEGKLEFSFGYEPDLTSRDQTRRRRTCCSYMHTRLGPRSCLLSCLVCFSSLASAATAAGEVGAEEAVAGPSPLLSHLCKVHRWWPARR